MIWIELAQIVAICMLVYFYSRNAADNEALRCQLLDVKTDLMMVHNRLVHLETKEEEKPIEKPKKKATRTRKKKES